LALRALIARLIYAARFVRRLPRRVLLFIRLALRRIVVLPGRWLFHHGKMRVHAFLVSRKGEPDRVP
jgi:hypothetical protein